MLSVACSLTGARVLMARGDASGVDAWRCAARSSGTGRPGGRAADQGAGDQRLGGIDEARRVLKAWSSGFAGIWAIDSLVAGAAEKRAVRLLTCGLDALPVH